MQLTDKSGICCDICGMVYEADFTYYSFDFRYVSVIENRRQSIDSIIQSAIIFSIDICTNCFENTKNLIIKNYTKIMGPKRAQSSTIICDMTGQLLFGTYDYYYCVVAKIDVKLSCQPNVCVKCGKKTFDSKKCDCGGINFTCSATMKIDNRYLEINVCEEAFKAFREKSETIKKTAGQWSTKS